jgi:hypothetical protein
VSCVVIATYVLRAWLHHSIDKTLKKSIPKALYSHDKDLALCVASGSLDPSLRPHAQKHRGRRSGRVNASWRGPGKAHAHALAWRGAHRALGGEAPCRAPASGDKCPRRAPGVELRTVGPVGRPMPGGPGDGEVPVGPLASGS